MNPNITLTPDFVGGHKGFQMTFENGWTASVQFGAMNYCEHKNLSHKAPSIETSVDAEVAAWDYSHEWYNFGDDEVEGWVTPDKVAAFLFNVSQLPDTRPPGLANAVNADALAESRTNDDDDLRLTA